MLKPEQFTTLERKIERFSQILDDKPGDGLTVLALAEASFRRGLKLEALTAYQVVTSEKAIPEAHLAVAEIYSQQSMTSEAYGELRRLFEVDPDNVEARLLANVLRAQAPPPEDIALILNQPSTDEAFVEAKLRLQIQRAIHNRELQERTRNVTLEPGCVIHEYYVEEAMKKLLEVDVSLKELEELRLFNETLKALPRPGAVAGDAVVAAEAVVAAQPVAPVVEPTLAAEHMMPEAPVSDVPMASPDPGPVGVEPVSSMPAPEQDEPPTTDPTVDLGLPVPDLAPDLPPQPGLPVEPELAAPEVGLPGEPVAVEEMAPIQPEPQEATEAVAIELDANPVASEESQAAVVEEPTLTLEVDPVPEPEPLAEPMAISEPETPVLDSPPEPTAVGEIQNFEPPSLEAMPLLPTEPVEADGSIPSSEEPAIAEASVPEVMAPPEPVEPVAPPEAVAPPEPVAAPPAADSFDMNFEIGVDSPVAPDLPDAPSTEQAGIPDLKPIEMGEELPMPTMDPAATPSVPAISVPAIDPVAVEMPVEELTSLPTVVEEPPAEVSPPEPVAPEPVAPEPEVSAPEPVASAADRQAFYESKAEELGKLTGTLARTRGVTSIFLVARDGTTIDSVVKDDITEERVGELVCESFDFLLAYAKSPSYWVLECSGGIFVMQTLDDEHVLIAIGQAGANFGALRYTMDKTKTKFGAILQDAPR